MGSDRQVTGLDDVTVAFGGGLPALRGVTLLAEPGEVVSVVGPSGSGKTTLLRAVAGLERVRSGRVLVGGRDVTRLPTPERRLAMVFQSPTLVPFLGLASDLARAVRGEPAPAAAPRRRLRFGRPAGRGPRVASGPAGIVRGGPLHPPVAFLLDEPLAHLDAAERVRLRHTVVSLVKRAGVAAFYVSQDQAEAMAVADRLAVLRDGEVVQVDVPRRVYDRPVDLFVAGFVGEPGMGLLPAHLVGDRAGAGYRIGPRTLPLWGPAPDGLRDGQPVVLGLRAEDVVLAGPAASAESVTLPAAIVDVERTGGRVVVTLEVDAPGEADGARLHGRFDPGTGARPGSHVEVAVDARRAHVFDPGTGRALHHPVL